MNLSRRGVLLGLGAAIAAPAIVKYANIMPVRNRLVVRCERGSWSGINFVSPQDLRVVLNPAEYAVLADEFTRVRIDVYQWNMVPFLEPAGA